MNKKQSIDIAKVSFKILLVFIGAYLMIDYSWVYRLQDFSKGHCIAHKSDTYAEYLVLNKTSDQYNLGVLGNNEIKQVPLEYEFTKKSYLNQFYKRVECPSNIDKMKLTNSVFIHSTRTQRMIDDIENLLKKKSK